MNTRWLVLLGWVLIALMWVWPTDSYGGGGTALALGVTGLALLISEGIRSQ